MVASKSLSYADRAKHGRPSAAPTKSASTAQATPSTSIKAGPLTSSTANLAGNTTSAKVEPSSGPTRVPARLDLASTGTNDQSVSSSDHGQSSPTAVNGSSSSVTNLSAPTTPPSTTPTPPSAKQNVWTTRQEKMNAARSAPHSAQPSTNSQIPTSLPPSTPSNISASIKGLSIPASHPNSSRSSVSGADVAASVQTQSSPADQTSSAPVTASSVKGGKKKGATKAPQVTTTTPPSFEEKGSWPAPSEAAPSSGGGNGLGRRDSHTPATEEDRSKQPSASHSRDSSVAGAAERSGHGKKQHWVRMPPAELQEAVDSAHPSAGRGRRSVDGERRNGVHPMTGNRSSGQNSKRSSIAPSPAQPHPLPLAPVSTTPTLNANAQPFSARGLANLLNPSMGQIATNYRSHPHSPMTRSPFLSSHSQSALNSPRMVSGYNASPQGLHALQNPPPIPNPLRQPQHDSSAPPPPKRKVRRPTPSESSAIGGDIPQLPDDSNGYRPVFGTVGTEPEVGLGLTMGADATKAELSIITQPSPETLPVVRWEERERVPTEAENILKTQGKYGIGVDSSESIVEKAILKQPDAPSLAAPRPEDETAVAQDEDGAVGPEYTRSPKHKWSFGSLDKATAELPPMGPYIPGVDMMTVDPSRRPPLSLPYTDPNTVNGYAGYDNRGATDGQYAPQSYANDRRGGDGAPYSPLEGGANGFGQRGYRRGRGGPRGYGGRGGYGGRPPMQGYRNGIQSPPGPQPQSLYGYPQQYDPSAQVPYVPPGVMSPVDYHPPMEPYGPSAVPPLTPGGSVAPMSATDPSFPPPTGYPYSYPPPPMPGMAYPPPVPYYPPYGPPPMYPMMPYSPAPYTAGPPMPPPMTTLGYHLDPLRCALLGQVEYYFSVQNMSQDMFLRSRMDAEGWIDVVVIASFNRIRNLVGDVNLVREVLGLSAFIELSQDGEKCRMANNQWEPYLLSAGSQPQSRSHSQPPFHAESHSTDGPAPDAFAAQPDNGTAPDASAIAA